ncbi:MAG: 16S rRNA (adenine(1518)-N(6)/adenine(1519)-N(6))-dimethyltransferase RsmA [Clostridiales bacterium]|nr:16S rRNA (adenine(1518)-N(6)/adenine(1519)-N(6))-dimethyltransferase RsmA [Clostridiales bacterium]
MKNLSDISVVKEILAKHGFTFSKALGQNFIINQNICPEMADMAIPDDDYCALEIGPGIGVLTYQLARRAKKVVAIELDKRLLPVLDETLAEFDNVEIVNADVMKLDLAELIKEKFSGEKICVCANLPYYITSPIIMLLLESKLPVESLTVMVQKEAADRLCAEVGSRESGAVTVAVNYYARAEKLFNVSKGSFMPAPKVDSAVIKLSIREKPPVEITDEKKFFSMVKAAFAQRRKTALNSISAGMGLSKEKISSALEKAGLDLNVRAEKLTMQQLADLCEAIEE